MNYKNTFLVTLLISFTTLVSSFAQTISKNAITQSDYSYGLQKAITIKKTLLEENYQAVEDLFLVLSSDNISHTTDFLALNSNEEELKKWSKETKNSEVSQVILATYYAHKGWAVRGNGYAEDVPAEDRFGFDYYQKKALDLYKNVKSNKLLKAEAYSRLIRVYMSLDDLEKGTETFEKCIQLDPLKVWAYIHQSEAIQPKWGGSMEAIAAFRKQITVSKLINQIISLKLVIDSHISGDNLTGNSNTDFKMQSKELIVKIDKQVSKNPPKSILKYILYNYMVANAQEAKNQNMTFNYFYKMKDLYTLYPFGIQ